MDLWISEEHLKGYKTSLQVEKQLYSKQSKYQRIDVFETKAYGRIFTLDGIIMVTEKDEFVYHEMMAHIPSNIHPNPKRALVIGGGDGGTIRELAKHNNFEELHLCEIDKEVVNISLEYFPAVSSVLEKDNRVSIFYEDGIEFLNKKKNYYDIICVDSTDPVGPAVGLFKKDFYKKCYNSLKEDGILIAQSESPWFNEDIIKEVQKSFSEIFPISKLSIASLLAYQSGLWGFAIGSKKYHPVDDISIKKADEMSKYTKYYNTGIHKASFVLPNFIKNYLK